MLGVLLLALSNLLLALFMWVLFCDVPKLSPSINLYNEIIILLLYYIYTCICEMEIHLRCILIVTQQKQVFIVLFFFFATLIFTTEICFCCVTINVQQKFIFFSDALYQIETCFRCIPGRWKHVSIL